MEDGRSKVSLLITIQLTECASTGHGVLSETILWGPELPRAYPLSKRVARGEVFDERDNGIRNGPCGR